MLKSAIAAASLLLTSTAIPHAAFAQEQSAASESIVVTAKYKRAWDKGSSLEADGLKQMQKARKQLINSSANVVKAENLKESSLAIAENAAAEFRNLTSNMPYFTDAIEAQEWAKQVQAASTEWAKFDARREQGEKQFVKATKEQARAQALVDKAQARIDEGRSMKAEAEQMSALASNP